MYFENEGFENSQKTVELAIATATARKIGHIVIASNSGASAKLFQKAQGIQVVCVTHVNGMRHKGENEMAADVRADLIRAGFQVLTTTHVLSGAERGISKQFGGVYPVEIIAHSLRMFGQGTKVCVEIAVMALDAGLIPYGQPVVAIGGTKGGADTALILTPAHAAAIFDTRIHEIICKPA